MQISWMEALGLIGVTIVVTRGKIFDGLRGWLKGFINPFNPFRLFGELISCPMCSGVWIGFGWGFFQEQSFLDCLMFGGFISLASFVTDNVTGILELFCDRFEKEAPNLVTLEQLAQAKAALRHERQSRGIPTRARNVDIDEDEAEALADEEERVADESIVPRDVLKQYEKLEV